MGDHRAEVHIKFYFHGKTYKLDMDWINWSPWGSECEGIDQRVIDFFQRSTASGMEKYHKVVDKYHEEREKAEKEEQERRDLERLKKKYES